MLTPLMCLSTEMNAKISAAIYTIRAFPTASPPLLRETIYANLQQRGRNEEKYISCGPSTSKKCPIKCKIKSTSVASGGRSNQPRSQLSLLQRRVKKTSRTITVDERGRASERGRRPSSIRTRAPSPFSPNGGSEPCKSRKWPRGNEGERKTPEQEKDRGRGARARGRKGREG